MASNFPAHWKLFVPSLAESISCGLDQSLGISPFHVSRDKGKKFSRELKNKVPGLHTREINARHLVPQLATTCSPGKQLVQRLQSRPFAVLTKCKCWTGTILQGRTGIHSPSGLKAEFKRKPSSSVIYHLKVSRLQEGAGPLL